VARLPAAKRDAEAHWESGIAAGVAKGNAKKLYKRSLFAKVLLPCHAGAAKRRSGLQKLQKS